jgi:phosphohistidine phosphatase SixA
MHALVKRFAAAIACLLLALGSPVLAQQVLAIPNADSSVPATNGALSGAQLVRALRRGGYVVYFRHTATDSSRNDTDMRSYDDCAHQRPLSAQGRNDALAMGQRIRALHLAPGEVLASPFCRTMDTARLMMREATARPDVRETEGGDYAGLKRLLAAPVSPGRNRWIVGHGNPFHAVAGPPRLAEGEAAVIEPHATHWTVVARITVEGWQALAAPP